MIAVILQHGTVPIIIPVLILQPAITAQMLSVVFEALNSLKADVLFRNCSVTVLSIGIEMIVLVLELNSRCPPLCGIHEQLIRF